MSFLPNYEDDIFISYAHNDNQALLEGQRGWIDNFHQALENVTGSATVTPQGGAMAISPLLLSDR